MVTCTEREGERERERERERGRERENLDVLCTANHTKTESFMEHNILLYDACINCATVGG